ncbi:MAG: glutamate--tRNA ligase [Bacteroidales bacterium]|uniref:glutamate--tRNA ligase n=1 Tax=Porphyromonas sp. TaxID=1924944 RepID=UPI002974634F|nr:glutamate--tRNA ligase [Porphyromonas sp.]MDD7438834.1 glutamate--tRNA ligase [Bacteroidales bacterium]MDY3066538.1 glutamate--tRNA ligase [Porphyromonas sp.]
MVRVRFAPSPTGALHIGGVRTALFNYLFARHHGGTMILRIEDTDSKRFVPGAEAYIVESLRWLGIEIDEGVGSDHQPLGSYRQSERKDIYKKYVQQLLDAGRAYYAFDTVEELEAARNEMDNFSYDASTRTKMRNSLSLSKDEVEHLIAEGKDYVVRFLVEPNRDVEVNDLIRGRVVINSNILDDKVLYKSSDELPTYHLANIVDDHLMEVTHVIRGEEWLPSAPLHVLLYEAFGWEAPHFAHLSLILKPTGNGKLSKRDGDKLGFPVFPLEWVDPSDGAVSMGYREQGYLPHAVVNFLALLGWNPGTEQEIFSMEELTKAFSLDRCSKSGARFDFEKAKWFNHHYIQERSLEELSLMIRPMLEREGISPAEDKLQEAISTAKEKVQLLPEFVREIRYLFVAPTEFEEKGMKKHWKEETTGYIRQMIALLQSLDKEASAEVIEQALYERINGDESLPMGKVMNGMRMAMVGEGRGAKIHEIIHILGIPESIRRMEYAIEANQ